jgi:zinc transport system ATP-binding protein
VAILVVLHELGPLEDLLDRCVVLQNGRVIYTGALHSAPGAGSDAHHHDDDAAPPGAATVLPRPTLVPGGVR